MATARRPRRPPQHTITNSPHPLLTPYLGGTALIIPPTPHLPLPLHRTSRAHTFSPVLHEHACPAPPSLPPSLPPLTSTHTPPSLSPSPAHTHTLPPFPPHQHTHTLSLPLSLTSTRPPPPLPSLPHQHTHIHSPPFNPHQHTHTLPSLSPPPSPAHTPLNRTHPLSF